MRVEDTEDDLILGMVLMTKATEVPIGFFLHAAHRNEHRGRGREAADDRWAARILGSIAATQIVSDGPKTEQ
jgi:hypothetical protein